MVCRGGQSIMFAWAKNAPPTTLPQGVSFLVDPSQRRYLVLQVGIVNTIIASKIFSVHRFIMPNHCRTPTILVWVCNIRELRQSTRLEFFSCSEAPFPSHQTRQANIHSCQKRLLMLLIFRRWHMVMWTVCCPPTLLSICLDTELMLMHLALWSQDTFTTRRTTSELVDLKREQWWFCTFSGIARLPLGHHSGRRHFTRWRR